eukprot:PhM_4_TR13280/c0_g1_i1/m.36339
MLRGGTCGEDDTALGATADGVLEHARELGVTPRHVTGLLRQALHNVPQRQQRGVNCLGLFFHDAFLHTRLREALVAGEIDKHELAGAVLARAVVVLRLGLDLNKERRVPARRLWIHLRCCNHTVLVAVFIELAKVGLVANLLLDDSRKRHPVLIIAINAKLRPGLWVEQVLQTVQIDLNEGKQNSVLAIGVGFYTIKHFLHGAGDNTRTRRGEVTHCKRFSRAGLAIHHHGAPIAFEYVLDDGHGDALENVLLVDVGAVEHVIKRVGLTAAFFHDHGFVIGLDIHQVAAVLVCDLTLFRRADTEKHSDAVRPFWSFVTFA